MGTPRLDNHRQSFNCRLIAQFNVSWLSSAQHSISVHFSRSLSRLENSSPNSPDLKSVDYSVSGRCNILSQNFIHLFHQTKLNFYSYELWLKTFSSSVLFFSRPRLAEGSKPFYFIVNENVQFFLAHPVQWLIQVWFDYVQFWLY